MPKNNANTKPHLPVMVKEALECLKPKAGESYLDLTAGWGGHAEAILKQTGAPGKSLLVDRDAEAISELKQKFKTAEILHEDFAGACQRLAKQGRTFDMVLADLGISSPHIDKAERGFSFTRSGRLDMRMDRRQELSAWELVNQSSEAELAGIIRRYGEEPRASRIASAIVKARPVNSTAQLAEVITGSLPRWRSSRKVHPATKTFQALRIAVNAELEQLAEILPLMEQLLAPGGRLAVISFHSLEDRMVKKYLAEEAHGGYDSPLRLLTKKPLTPSSEELLTNPRARSAKLRAAVKIKI